MRIPRLFLACCLVTPIASAATEPTPPPLPAPLEQAITRSGLAPGELSLVARFTGADKPFATVASDRAVIPASTQKIFTTACALDHLSASRTFITELRSTELPDADGRISGDLILVGGGDPQLQAEDLWAAVRELSALGVRHIGGNLIVDASLFAPPSRPAAWPQTISTNPYDASQGAAALAWNSVELIVRPGREIGSPARVEGFPVLAGARIDNRVRTAEKSSITVVSLPEAHSAAAGGIRLNGTIALRGKPWRRWVHLGDPAAVTLAALGELLAAEGITVDGESKAGSAAGAPHLMVRRDSRPLGQLVSAINKFSSNFGAEMLARHLALANGNPAGRATAAEGARAVRDCLQGWALPLEKVVIADGSGLSRRNRTTTQLLMELLEKADRSPSWAAEFRGSLARAGEDGSMRRRLGGLKGRLRAKTGSLQGVAALAGYGITQDQRSFVFAVVINATKSKTKVGTGVVDKLVRALFLAAEQQPPENPGEPTSNNPAVPG